MTKFLNALFELIYFIRKVWMGYIICFNLKARKAGRNLKIKNDDFWRSRRRGHFVEMLITNIAGVFRCTLEKLPHNRDSGIYLVAMLPQYPSYYLRALDWFQLRNWICNRDIELSEALSFCWEMAYISSFRV
jgi:hypothetical protein